MCGIRLGVHLFYSKFVKELGFCVIFKILELECVICH
jgi:hypothetical protein